MLSLMASASLLLIEKLVDENDIFSFLKPVEAVTKKAGVPNGIRPNTRGARKQSEEDDESN